jgi:radical SAM protein with 4Fe4S-binding SPASM domain
MMKEKAEWFHHPNGKMSKTFYYSIAAALAPSTLRMDIKNVCLCLNLDQCNLRCIMCWQTSARESNRQKYKVVNMPREALLQILRSNGIKSATISVVGGGEPFLYPYIQDLLVEAPNNSKRLMIMTNGTLLHQNPTLWEMAEEAPITLMFSIDAATPETYEKVRPPAKWSTLIRNIERFIEVRERNPRLDLTTSFVVLQQNLDELLPFMKLNAQWKSEYVHIHPAIEGDFPKEWCIDRYDPYFLDTMVDVIRFAHSHPIKLDRLEEIIPPDFIRKGLPPFDQIADILPFFSDQQKSKPSHDPRQGCHLHSDSMTISHLGDIYLCDTAFRICYSCGNLFSDGLEDAWLSPQWLSVRLAHKLGLAHIHPLCRNCILVNKRRSGQ